MLHFRAVGFERGGPKRRIGVRHGVRLAGGHGRLIGASMKTVGVLHFIHRCWITRTGPRTRWYTEPTRVCDVAAQSAGDTVNRDPPRTFAL